MSEWTVDMRVKITAEEPHEAAALCAHLLSMAASSGMPILPQFVGVWPTDREPDAIDGIIAQANGEAPQAPADQARGVFDGIMQAPSM